MNYEIGDVIVWNRKWPGHVGMIYEPNANRYKIKVIHAQGQGKNFHIEANQQQRGNSFSFLLDNNILAFRPPWGKCQDRQGRQRVLQQVAEGIRDHAEYGYYRAIRLCVGSSKFSDGARGRLAKYRGRYQYGLLEGGKGKFVSTVTCAEAVILCYQLAFGEADHPFFIRLDAAHTMPATLGEWLGKHWEKVYEPQK
jgi:hypothetical protein